MTEGTQGSVAAVGVERNPDLIKAAFARIDEHDAQRLNAVANAVMDVQGFALLDVRYAIAVLALEALDGIPVLPNSGASS